MLIAIDYGFQAEYSSSSSLRDAYIVAIIASDSDRWISLSIAPKDKLDKGGCPVLKNTNHSVYF